MIESVLVRREASRKTKIAVKSLIALAVVALAVALPQLVHLVAGAGGGVRWLPMYLPVLLGGCLLGWRWGLGTGVAAPVVSFLVTSLFGEAMPAAARLPFMVAELAVFAAVSGAFSAKIEKNAWFAFPAVILAEVGGRTVFFLLVLAFQALTPLSPAAVLSQIRTGIPALILQAVIVPLLVIGLRALLKRDGND